MLKKIITLISLSMILISAYSFEWLQGWEVKTGLNSRNIKGFTFSTSPEYINNLGDPSLSKTYTWGASWGSEEEQEVGADEDGNPIMGTYSEENTHLYNPVIIYENPFYPMGVDQYGYTSRTTSYVYSQTYENILSDAVATDSSEQSNNYFITLSKEIYNNTFTLNFDIGFSKNSFSGQNSATPLTQNIYELRRDVTTYYYYEYFTNNFQDTTTTMIFISDTYSQSIEDQLRSHGVNPSKFKPHNSITTTQSLNSVYQDQYNNAMKVDITTVSLGFSSPISLGSGLFQFIPGAGITINQIDMNGRYNEQFINITLNQIVAQTSLNDNKSETVAGLYAAMEFGLLVGKGFGLGISGRYDYLKVQEFLVGPSSMKFNGSGYSAQLFCSYRF
jgi:hypothetical protein